MKPKHTPGKWRVLKPDVSFPDVVSDIGIPDHWVPVCRVRSDAGSFDAHLIASAPEMLEVLEYLHKRIFIEEVAGHFHHQMLHKLEEVLAKAKGEA